MRRWRGGRAGGEWRELRCSASKRAAEEEAVAPVGGRKRRARLAAEVSKAAAEATVGSATDEQLGGLEGWRQLAAG